MDWLLWQLADSAFPAGGLAHSSGLEAAWHHGEVTDSGELAAFLGTSLRQCAASILPIALEARRAPERGTELDAFCEAWITNHVANRASRLQGRALWTALNRSLLPAIGPAPEPGHLAPVFGRVLAELGVPVELAARLFLFQHLRSSISAAVRLGIVGALAAQGLHYGLVPLAEALAEASRESGLDDLVQISPLLDLWQGAQDRLPSRLFQS